MIVDHSTFVTTGYMTVKIDIESTTLRVRNILCVGKCVIVLFISYATKSKDIQ